MSSPQPKTLSQEDIAKLKSYLVGQVKREPDSDKWSKAQAEQYLIKFYTNIGVNLGDDIRQQVLGEVYNELWGIGPLQPFLDDPEVNEIMVNRANLVYVEKKGKIVKTDLTFPNDAQIIQLIEKVILPLGRRIDHEHPAVDARLPDGSRFNAIIPPVAIDGPSITIRKFARDRLTMEKLIELRSVPGLVAEFLQACVVARLNIVISGGTGSGKTTLLNVLSGYIPENERIVTIEDSAELQLRQEHVVRLETKPADLIGKGEIVVRDLVRNALRMRPDRIVVGECRGGETLDMLQAMNTGHDGSLTTLHANTPRDGLSRLETLTLMSGMDLPLRIVREQIASAVDLIIQVTRLRDGARKVTQVTEVVGMEGDKIVMTDIFKFEDTGTDAQGGVIGELKPTGMRPLFSPRLEVVGFKLRPEIFGINLSDVLNSTRKTPGRTR